MPTDPTMLALLGLRLVAEAVDALVSLEMIRAGVTKEDLDKLQAERKEVVQEIRDTP